MKLCQLEQQEGLQDLLSTVVLSRICLEALVGYDNSQHPQLDA